VPLDVDKEIDRLYGLPPEEFVEERRRIERALRDEGRKPEADEVKALAKPTSAAWVVNQLAREERSGVDRLLEAGERLRTAQRAAVAGEGTASFDEAREEEAEARRRLTEAAESLLAGRGSKASRQLLDQVDQTLRAAAVSDEGRELLDRGRLIRELETGGFELLAGIAPRPAGQRPAASARAAGGTQRLEQVRAEVKEARSRAREAAQELRQAEREAAKARRALEKAETAVDEARREADEATAAVERAEDELAAARRR
jgi:hypothetical protein